MTKEQHEAFAAALEELFRQYPLPQYKYPRRQWRKQYDRETAVRNARAGDPLFMIDVFIDCHVPSKEVTAIHTLIYG